MSGRRAALILSCLLAAGLAACGGDDGGAGPGAPPSYRWDDPGLDARLDDALAGWARDQGLVGAAARVYTPGYLDWSGATGSVDRAGSTPFTTATPGRVASATKPFTASLILELRDEGLLDLDDRLSRYVPSYPNGDAITLEHLLRHRSGIPEIQLADGFFILSVLLNPDHWISPEELLRWTYVPIPILDLFGGALVPRRPLDDPGRAYHYSQPGFVALGLVIEQVTGEPLADVLAERRFGPLGLTGTHLPREGEPLDPAGYTNLFGVLPVKLPGEVLISSANGLNSAAWSAGGIVATAGDLVTFLSALLEGDVLAPASLAEMQSWLPVDPEDPTQGEYGLGLFRSFDDGTSYVGHDGALPGARSIMKYLPDLDVYVGAVANTDPDGGSPDLPARVRRALLADGPP